MPKQRRLNILRVDPSRTGLLRTRFRADLRRRFAKIRKALWDALVTKDALGIAPKTMMVFHGGPGSGNFGHSGRPGEVGGSGPGGGGGSGSQLGDAIKRGDSEYAKDAGIAYPKAEGVSIPRIGKDEIYLARYTSEAEHLGEEGIGYFAYAGKNPDDVVNATQSYAKGKTKEGYLILGRMTDPEWDADRTAESSGIEVNGILGTADAPVDIVIDLSSGDVWKPSNITTHASPEPQAFRFQTNPQKMRSFQRWFQKQVDEDILSVDAQGKPWTAQYVNSAYRQGIVRAYVDKNKPALARSKEFYEGGREMFLRQAFSAPESVQKIEMLYQRSFDQLKGITSQMSQSLSRELSSGLANGLNPRTIARKISKSISEIERKRAEVIARTEIIHAHAEGQLDSFERQGVRELNIMAEWSTAGDDRVCEQCAPLEGVVLTIKEARGMIPRHPNCRCTWIPANVGEDTEEQITSASEKRQAVRESLGEGNKEWVGSERVGTLKTVDTENPLG